MPLAVRMYCGSPSGGCGHVSPSRAGRCSGRFQHVAVLHIVIKGDGGQRVVLGPAVWRTCSTATPDCRCRQAWLAMSMATCASAWGSIGIGMPSQPGRRLPGWPAAFSSRARPRVYWNTTVER